MESTQTEQSVHCQCGRVMGIRCEWTGPRSETVVIEWMPEQHRASHTAAGNRGCWPANGSERLRVARLCADLIVDGDPDWAEVISAP